MNFDSTVQNIAWFRDQYRKGSLVIKPPFQRKPVWAARQKCYLIESMLLGLPVPEVYIQQSTTEEGDATYAVVDGQQRIRTVLQFIGSETDPNEQESNKFSLEKLEPGSQWQGRTFADLSKEEKERFYGYRFAVRYLNTKNDGEIRDMFRRLNKFLTPLKPQELRNATFMGPFARLAENLADNEYWAENRIITAASIRRMGDVEFVSELLIGVLHGPQAGSAGVIDEYYRQYEDYEDEFPEQRRAQKTFDENLRAIQQFLPNIKETRWSNKTDFYTLFVAVAFVQRPLDLSTVTVKQVRNALDKFETEVNRRLADEDAKVSKEAVEFVRAVEKGANDKQRRAARHGALLRVLSEHLKFKIDVE
ncbi:MAG: DUF262 domain-containing protein [Verrucomicrobia bacterium]|nr:DUF262 domain-containing protein [Verrucomicrobiota bacterium]